MAVKDIRSNLKEIIAFSATISSATDTTGSIIDTADFELGLMFSMLTTTFAANVLTLSFEESDADDMAGATVISGDQLIGIPPVISAATVAGDTLQTVGIISNKRYVRPTINSTTTGSCQTVVIATQKAENMPVS